MKTYETLNLYAGDLVIGKHGVWWPGEALKIPFQWGGRIQKYQKPQEASYSLDLLQEEKGLLDWLSAHRFAPPVGEWVYFKTVISDHLGAYWEDPCGAYGYRMADAHSLPPGAIQPLWDVGEQIRREAGPLLTGSPGAWNDLNKPGNVINGYLVDVRRSGWDRLHWHGPAPALPRYHEDRTQLHLDLVREGQFPYKERTQPYQEYFLDGAWHPGEREVVRRARILGFAPITGERVLDIGCQLGGFLQYAAQHRDHTLDGHLVGLDLNPAYIDLAQRLARANGWNICYRNVSIEDPTTLDWLGALWGQEPSDHVLLLSMLKHLSQGETTLWRLVDTLRARWTYVETNAVKLVVNDRGLDVATGVPLLAGAEARHGKLVGWSKDRNFRACYRIPHHA